MPTDARERDRKWWQSEKPEYMDIMDRSAKLSSQYVTIIELRIRYLQTHLILCLWYECQKQHTSPHHHSCGQCVNELKLSLHSRAQQTKLPPCHKSLTLTMSIWPYMRIHVHYKHTYPMLFIRGRTFSYINICSYITHLYFVLLLHVLCGSGLHTSRT